MTGSDINLRTKAAVAVNRSPMAALFGGFHLMLAFDGFTPIYVLRFTIAATAFGALAPTLYLRARRGFFWAYGLHWAFYALDATVTRFVLAIPAS
jgi:hypothetical protein